MVRLNLRSKLLILSSALAVVPLLIAGRTMIHIMQDELKSSANDALVNTARQVVEEINDHYQNTWLGPLRLVRNAIEDERLGVAEKVSLLKSGVRDIADIAALQVTVEGVENPLLATETGFADRLGVSADALTRVLLVEPDSQLFAAADTVAADLQYLKPGHDWLLTIAMPIRGGLAGRRAVLTARVSMNRVARFLADHPFNRVGQITLVDRSGRRILAADRDSLGDYEMVRSATAMLSTPARPIAVAPYRRPSGDTMLGAFAFPDALPWAVLVEQNERNAYAAVQKMVESLGVWVLVGLAIATVGAGMLALRLSRPICEMDRVVQEVSQGNLGVRVEGIRSRDELGHLAGRINEMIRGLTERFNLEKFVSAQTVSAVKGSDEGGVRLGGERRLVTVLFSDIRGFTAFSEQVEPEVVIDMLNTYLRHQADIVEQYNGDVDKFVGDELVAVFQGPDMVVNAVRCAQAIQHKIAQLNESLPEWPMRIGIGISTGEVVMGAMGSEQRMDYTILGDAVNLGARLCAHANAGDTLLSEASYKRLPRAGNFAVTPMDGIRVKGKAQRVRAYRLRMQSGTEESSKRRGRQSGQPPASGRRFAPSGEQQPG